MFYTDEKVTKIHLIISINMTKVMSKENISVSHPGKLEINSEIKWSLMMLGKGGFMSLWMFKDKQRISAACSREDMVYLFNYSITETKLKFGVEITRANHNGITDCCSILFLFCECTLITCSIGESLFTLFTLLHMLIII